MSEVGKTSNLWQACKNIWSFGIDSKIDAWKHILCLSFTILCQFSFVHYFVLSLEESTNMSKKSKIEKVWNIKLLNIDRFLLHIMHWWWYRFYFSLEVKEKSLEDACLLLNIILNIPKFWSLHFLFFIQFVAVTHFLADMSHANVLCRICREGLQIGSLTF